MPYKGGVQLLPDTERRPTLSTYTSGNTFFYIAVVVGAFILVASATLSTYKANLREKIDAVRAQIVTQDNARNREQEKTLIAASKQSKILSDLVSNKLYWSQALAYIEQMTQSSVKFINFDAQVAKGTISFKATTSNYTIVAQQLALFAKGVGISDFSIGKIESTAKGTIEFSGELNIDTKTLLMKAKPTPSPSPKP